MPHMLCPDHLLSAERPGTQLNKSETQPVVLFFFFLKRESPFTQSYHLSFKTDIKKVFAS